MHTFTIQGVDQGPFFNNIANQDHYIMGQDKPYIHNLPTSREALFHSMLKKDPFIEHCLYNVQDTYPRRIEVSKKHHFMLLFL